MLGHGSRARTGRAGRSTRARLPAFEQIRGREQAPAARVRGRERLAGRELLALHRRLERVVVAVGAPAFLERDPPQHRAVGRPRRRRRATTPTRAPRRACARATGSSTRDSGRRCARRGRRCRPPRRSRSRRSIRSRSGHDDGLGGLARERRRSRGSALAPAAVAARAVGRGRRASRSTSAHARARRRRRAAPARRVGRPLWRRTASSSAFWSSWARRLARLSSGASSGSIALARLVRHSAASATRGAGPEAGGRGCAGASRGSAPTASSCPARRRANSESTSASAAATSVSASSRGGARNELDVLARLAVGRPSAVVASPSGATTPSSLSISAAISAAMSIVSLFPADRSTAARASTCASASVASRNVRLTVRYASSRWSRPARSARSARSAAAPAHEIAEHALARRLRLVEHLAPLPARVLEDRLGLDLARSRASTRRALRPATTTSAVCASASAVRAASISVASARVRSAAAAARRPCGAARSSAFLRMSSLASRAERSSRAVSSPSASSSSCSDSGRGARTCSSSASIAASSSCSLPAGQRRAPRTPASGSARTSVSLKPRTPFANDRLATSSGERRGSARDDSLPPVGLVHRNPHTPNARDAVCPPGDMLIAREEIALARGSGAVHVG